MGQVFLLFFFLFSGHPTDTQQKVLVKKDLKSAWQTYEDGSYQPFNSSPRATQVVYIQLVTDVFKGDKLLIEGNEFFSVFINGRLIFDRCKRVETTLDSLSAIGNGNPLLISIYNDQGINYESLNTLIVAGPTVNVSADAGPLVRQGNEFQNFVVVSMLSLAILFVIILRLNPKHTFQYFSLLKLISLRDSDDSQTFSRITSSSNMLLYIFASLLSGFVIILLLSDNQSGFTLSVSAQTDTFAEEIFRWLEISAMVLLAFVAKGLVVASTSILFGIRDQAGFQFLNFMRVVLLSMVLLAAFGASYFILQGESGEFLLYLFQVIKWIILIWIILAYAKLMGRVHFSAIHLFLYICATEIIPFLLTIKILYE